MSTPARTPGCRRSADGTDRGRRLAQRLRHVIAGAHTHVAHRTFSLYWQARAGNVLAGLSLRADDRVLDIGCGQGLWTSWLAPRAARTVALDPFAECIEAARRWRAPRPPLQPTSSVHWCLGSGEHLPFRSASFTKVAALDVMDLIPDDHSAASEIGRVLEPHGVVVVTNLAKNRKSVFIRLEPLGYRREYDADSLSDLLESAGLSVTRVFYFYYLFGMMSRELQVLADGSVLRRVPIVLLLAQAALSLLGRLDSLLPIGAPGGIGIVAFKRGANGRTPRE